MLKKYYSSLEETAKQLSCTTDDLIQFAAYGQIELCILIPRNYFTPFVYKQDGTLADDDYLPIAARNCGPCAVYPADWRTFLADTKRVIRAVKWIYAGPRVVDDYQNLPGFKLWISVPEDAESLPVTILECAIVIRQEEIERIFSEQKRGAKQQLSLIIRWPRLLQLF